MNWYKKAQGYIASDLRFDYPYSLLEEIKMQKDGFPLNMMTPAQLKDAKEYEKLGVIKKVIKKDDKGNYLAYVIDEDRHKKPYRKMSPFEEIDLAYKQGKTAGKNGKPIESNPYPKPSVASKSHSQYSSWVRGWMAGKK